MLSSIVLHITVQFEHCRLMCHKSHVWSLSLPKAEPVLALSSTVLPPGGSLAERSRPTCGNADLRTWPQAPPAPHRAYSTQ